MSKISLFSFELKKTQRELMYVLLYPSVLYVQECGGSYKFTWLLIKGGSHLKCKHFNFGKIRSLMVLFGGDLRTTCCDSESGGI